MSDQAKMELKDYRDIVIQSGLQLIPSIGSSLSTAYFGYKQKIRFKRIENFYNDLAKKVERFESSTTFMDINDDNQDEVIAMIEQLNEEIEKQSQDFKREFFMNFFMNFMDKKNNEEPHNDNFLYFEILKELSINEIDLLIHIRNKGSSGVIYRSDKTRAETYKLINCGLVDQENSERYGNDFQSIEQSIYFRTTSLGDSFYGFCLYPD